MGMQLPLVERAQLLAFLRNNLDVFTWNTYEALGVNLDFTCYHLNVNPTIVPSKQQPWRSSKEHVDA